MLAKVLSFGLQGIDAYPIDIEVDISRGLPALNLVGLPDSAIKESKERVRSAIKNSGYNWPAERITVSLAPSGIRKEGACFDLAIALGILAATEQINSQNLNKYYLLGELSLDGSIKPIKGALPIAMKAAKSCATETLGLIIPQQNAKEAAIVLNTQVFPAKTLREIIEFLNDPAIIKPFKTDLNDLLQINNSYNTDFADVKGQYLAKRALEVAATGGHNILMIGPPGSGKSMLAKRMPTIIPDLTLNEALEVSKIHSVTGELPNNFGLISTRPFRSLHHSVSSTALVGGGSIPIPGEISLAHQGVLFLDELPEFRRDCLEALRQPLEDGYIRVSRIFKSVIFPANFILVAAMNPCPCGYYTDPQKACRCNPNKIANYMSKISGPLMDRIDIHIELPPIKYQELTDTREAESSAMIKARVEKARDIQRERFKDDKIYYNAQMNSKLIKKYCVINNEGKELLKMAMTELGLSARAYDKVLKIARSIADLDLKNTVEPRHISEAITYRNLDKNI
jgi:magnesium chelatase family protein